MSADKCPKCGAERFESEYYHAIFKCSSVVLGSGELNQSDRCLETERDQLAEQVKRLREEVGKAWAEGVEHGSKPMSKSCSSWESSRAKRISEGGE